MLIYRCDLRHPQSPELPTDPELSAAVELLGTALSPRLTECVLWSDEKGIRCTWSELRTPLNVGLTLDPVPEWRLYGLAGRVSLASAVAMAKADPRCRRALWAAQGFERGWGQTSASAWAGTHPLVIGSVQGLNLSLVSQRTGSKYGRGQHSTAVLYPAERTSVECWPRP